MARAGTSQTSGTPPPPPRGGVSTRARSVLRAPAAWPTWRLVLVAALALVASFVIVLALILASGPVEVFSGDFADPSVLIVNPFEVYAYATNARGDNVPVLRGTLVGGVTLVGDALPRLPRWSAPGSVWAPSVRQTGPDAYFLYYATRDRRTRRQCLSVAQGTQPQGPFHDDSASPFECQAKLGGSIDPATVTVGRTTFLLWKSDGDCCGLPTALWSAPLTADGLRLAAPPVMILGATQAWEYGIVEGPSMVTVAGRFDLFFSGGQWNTSGYAMGVATCASPLGPCHTTSSGPFLSSRPGQEGPGGGEVFLGPAGHSYIVYAAWTNGHVGYAGGGSRSLFASAINLDRPVPVLRGIP